MMDRGSTDIGVTGIHRDPTFIRRIFIIPALPGMVPITIMIMVAGILRIIIPIQAAIPVLAAMAPIMIIMIAIITESEVFALLIMRRFLFWRSIRKGFFKNSQPPA